MDLETYDILIKDLSKTKKNFDKLESKIYKLLLRVISKYFKLTEDQKRLFCCYIGNYDNDANIFECTKSNSLVVTSYIIGINSRNNYDINNFLGELIEIIFRDRKSLNTYLFGKNNFKAICNLIDNDPYLNAYSLKKRIQNESSN